MSYQSKWHVAIKDVAEHATIWWCPKNQVQVVVCTDDEACEQCGTNFEEEAKERDEQAIAEGEARYRQSVLGDEWRTGQPDPAQKRMDDFADAEIAKGYANPDCLDSAEDFPGDDL